jgi:hypothetical protein
MIAFVREVMAHSIFSGSINASSSRTFTMTGRAPVSETGKGSRGESHGRHYHFVARTDVQRNASEVKRIRSARNADRVRNAAIFGKLAFEQEYFFTQDKIAPFDNPGDPCFDLLGDRQTLRLEIDQRY